MTMTKIHRHVRTVTHVKRSPEEVIEGTPTFDSSGQAVNTNASRTGDYAKNTVSSSTPPSTIALAVLLAISVVALVGGCLFWRIKKRRSQKGTGPQSYYSNSPHGSLFGMESRTESEAHSSLFGGHPATLEKPDKALIINPFPNEQTGWAPQIKDYRGVPLVNGQLPQHVQAAKEGKRWLKSLSRRDLNEKPAVETPPPSYFITNVGSNRSSDATLVRSEPPVAPLPPTPADSTITLRPPTPPTNEKKRKPSPLTTSSEPLSVPSSRFSHSPLPKTPGANADPLSSPARNSSFSHQQKSPLALRMSPTKHLSSVFKSGTGSDGLALPRLMSVINTFTPSLEDEMLVHVGETIRMVEEYNDGWCLVQRVGKSDAPRGVVPRFCLTERQSAIQTSTSRRNLIKTIQASSKLR